MAAVRILDARSIRRWCLYLGLIVCVPVCAADFNVDTLTGLIRSNDVRTLDEALVLLPAEMRANYVLAFASRSLQEASPVAPRAILYGTDARFILSFNGDAGQRGYDAIETMQFDDRSNSFHFREISFVAGRGARMSEDNPARCTVCHGTPARPIWDTPPNWPGVYGERYRAGLSKAESAGMRVFLARQPRDPRYRSLLGAARFADRETYVGSAHGRYDGASSEPPNARLSMLLATLNARSIISNLSEAAAFTPHRYSLLAAAAGECGAVQSFFPAPLRVAFTQALAAYAASSAAAGVNEQTTKRLRREAPADGYHGGVAASDPVELRFIAEQLIGLPRQRWSLALERNTYDMAAPDGALALEQLLFEKIADREPDLRALRTLRSFNSMDGYCAEMRRRSEAELATFYDAAGSERFRASARPAPANQTSQPRLLDHCIACHNGEVGPALPFGDPLLLASRLGGGGYVRGRLLDEILYRLTPQAGAERMPRDINLTSAEQEVLENYFIRLARPPIS
jgi:hypothetical protein